MKHSSEEHRGSGFSKEELAQKARSWKIRGIAQLILAAVTVMGYDAYLTALEALKAAGTTDPGEVMAVLPSVTATGITGEIKFGENGDADRNTAFIKTANTETGVWDFVTVQSVA